MLTDPTRDESERRPVPSGNARVTREDWLRLALETLVCEGVEDGTPVDTPEAGGTLAGDAYSGCASTADATGTGNGPPSLAASGRGTDAVDGADAAGRFTGALRLDSGSGDFAKSDVTHSDALVHQSLYQ